jgi:hypothetical protein
MSSLLVVQVLTGTVAGLLVAALCWNAASRWRLRRSGFGIYALDGFGHEVQRAVKASVVRIPDWTGGWDAGSVTETPYTVVTLAHQAHAPWVLELYDGDVSRLERSGFETWAHSHAVAPAPEALRASGDDDRLHDALIINDLAYVRGVIRLEPTVVRFAEEGDLLDPDYLRMVGGLLVRLAESAEREFPRAIAGGSEVRAARLSSPATASE